MSYRTATASGIIRNRGNVPAVFKARMYFAYKWGTESSHVYLESGESAYMNVPSVGKEISSGATVSVIVFISRVSPNPSSNVAQSSPVSWTEP